MTHQWSNGCVIIVTLHPKRVLRWDGGYEKGAFTNAARQRKGHFESAHGGTLFLDEIGELPKDMQVKLLRVLEEDEVVRIGASKPISVDVRIMAATNRTLIEEVGEGRFRDDWFLLNRHSYPLRQGRRRHTKSPIR